MQKKHLSFILVGILISQSLLSVAQCCSGGVPMAGNIGMPIAKPGILQVSANFDHNLLDNFLTGNQIAEEPVRRQRSTNSILLESSYTFNNLFSLDVMIPLVNQRRLVNTNKTSTAGIGDVVILPKITLASKYTFGIGAKLPTGSTNEQNNSIPLIIDLQPGSGASDLLFHFSYASNLIKSLPTTNTFLNLNYRSTGTYRKYLNAGTYKFGNELQLIGGISNRFTIFNSLQLDTSLKLRFRKAFQDTSNEILIANSGGHWLFINPGLSYLFSPMLSYQVNLELPLLQQVQGTQLSPTIRLNTGILLIISYRDDKIYPPKNL